MVNRAVNQIFGTGAMLLTLAFTIPAYAQDYLTVSDGGSGSIKAALDANNAPFAEVIRNARTKMNDVSEKTEPALAKVMKSVLERLSQFEELGIILKPSRLLAEGELFRVVVADYSINDMEFKLDSKITSDQLAAVLPLMMIQANTYYNLTRSDDHDNFRFIFNHTVGRAHQCLTAKPYSECVLKFGPAANRLAILQDLYFSNVLVKLGLPNIVRMSPLLQQDQLHDVTDLLAAVGTIKGAYRKLYPPLFAEQP